MMVTSVLPPTPRQCNSSWRRRPPSAQAPPRGNCSRGAKKSAGMSALYSGLARSACRYRWWFLAVWLVVLVLAGIGAGQIEKFLKVGGFSIPGTEFNTTSSILSRQLHLSSDKAALVVFHSPTLRVTDKGFFDAVQTASENLQREPFVSKVETFYTTGIPDMVSPENHTTYALVTL